MDFSASYIYFKRPRGLRLKGSVALYLSLRLVLIGIKEYRKEVSKQTEIYTKGFLSY